MKMNKPIKVRYAIFKAPLLVGALLFLFVVFFNSNTLFKMPTASAGTPYGILGQMAPELNLSNWIDGNGKKTDPIRLSDHRGKIVYLYFFQDW